MWDQKVPENSSHESLSFQMILGDFPPAIYLFFFSYILILLKQNQQLQTYMLCGSIMLGGNFVGKCASGSCGVKMREWSEGA